MVCWRSAVRVPEGAAALCEERDGALPKKEGARPPVERPPLERPLERPMMNATTTSDETGLEQEREEKRCKRDERRVREAVARKR